MGKLVEGLWDCPFCDSKRIRAGQKTCPNCGHPQAESTKFYMPDAVEYVPEEKAEKISRNPDWQYSFCGSLNSDNLDSCANCGATKEESERNYFEMRQQEEEKKYKKEEQKAFSQRSESEEPRKSFLKNMLLLIGTFVTIVFSIFGLLASCFSPNVRNVTIDDFEWQSAIDVKENVTYDESGWTLPDDARLQYTQSEIKEYQPIIDHYKTVTETKTRPVFDHNEAHTSYKDLGNGYFEKHAYYTPVYRNETYTETHQEPVYRQEPVYATKYYYEIDRWQAVDHAVSSGNDQKPYWSKPKLGSKQKTGIKTERYSVIITYKNKKNKDVTKEYTMKYSDWKTLKKGKNVKLKLNKLGYAEIPNKDEASSGFVSNSKVDE